LLSDHGSKSSNVCVRVVLAWERTHLCRIPMNNFNDIS
jgi:hypothetical protein